MSSQDWKNKAQGLRENIDTGMLEERKCPTCTKVFSREKHLKYHMKECHQCTCDQCNETFDHEQKLKRHKNKKCS